jgi:diguanylate cyclase (GGDEF)-like protein
MRTLSIEHVLACPQLPSLPTVAVDVLALTSDVNVKLSEIARVVQNDQALCARILKTVNSSYYGLAKPCPTITRALTYLGLSTVKSLVLGFSLIDWAKLSGDFDMIAYWRRSVYSAAAARRIAGLKNSIDAEEAFIAALMQDIGMLAIYTTMGDEYVTIMSGAGENHNLLPAIERETLGFDHAEAGSKLAARWRLPDQIVQAIRLHHAKSSTSSSEIVRAIKLGAQAAHVLSVRDSGEGLGEFTVHASDWFGFTDLEAAGLLTTMAEDAHELSRLFQINTGTPPDINTILSQAEEASLQHQLNVVREAEALRQSNSALARKAITDALTNVGNRHHFDSELTARFSEAQEQQASLGVIMVDADKFKTLNDTYGHPAGDAVLVELANRMAAEVGDSGVVCRYGGEEFAVILPRFTRRASAELAERLRRMIGSEPVDLRQLQGQHESVPVTVSVGVAVYESTVAQRIISPQLLVQAADKALYAAKHAGRNCVRVFSAKPVAAAAQSRPDPVAAA